jgi:hypothetical protein
MSRILGLILICLIIMPSLCYGDDFRETRLDRGISNSEAYSYLLIEKSRENKTGAVTLLKKALEDSPDLPAVYFELAKASFSFSSSGIFAFIDYSLQGTNAYLRNFWWSFTFAGSLFFSLVISFVAAAGIIIALRFFTDIRLFVHDLRETKSALLMLVMLIILSLLSPFLLLAGMLILLGNYMKKLDRGVVYLFLVFLVFSPLLFRVTSLFVHVLSSPSMKAIVEVNESKGNTYALTTLKNRDDYASLFSYALALKRERYYSEAIAIYQRLLLRKSDPAVYVDLGNCYVGMGNMDEAMNSYLKAAEIRPLASAYYNLSQISREMLDYAKGNDYFKRALEIDRDAVSSYRLNYSRNPNRIVVDETLSFARLWDLAMTNTGKTSTFGVTVLPPIFIPVAAFMLIILYVLLNKLLTVKAYRCKRCSAILCQRCEKRLNWGQMCPACYASIVKLDELEVKERVARLLSVYEHQKKRRTVMRLLSFLMPGSSHIYAGKVFSGFLFLFPFLFFLFLPFTNTICAGAGLFFAHRFFTWAAIFIAAVIYIISNILTRLRITKGWL